MNAVVCRSKTQYWKMKAGTEFLSLQWVIGLWVVWMSVGSTEFDSIVPWLSVQCDPLSMSIKPRAREPPQNYARLHLVHWKFPMSFSLVLARAYRLLVLAMLFCVFMLWQNRSQSIYLGGALLAGDCYCYIDHAILLKHSKCASCSWKSSFKDTL